MHEYTFCQGIVDAVLAEWEPYKGAGAKILKVSVVIGKLHQVIEDNLRMAYTFLTKDTPAQDSELLIRFVDIEYECKLCGHRGIINPPLFLCDQCEGGDIEIVSGKELYLEKMEINQDE